MFVKSRTESQYLDRVDFLISSFPYLQNRLISRQPEAVQEKLPEHQQKLSVFNNPKFPVKLKSLDLL